MSQPATAAAPVAAKLKKGEPFIPKEGDYIDCKDQVGKWCQAKVLKFDTPGQRIYVNYLGWSEKWNTWVGLNENKIAPYRMHTPPDTGPDSNRGGYAMRDAGDVKNLSKFRTVATQLAALTERVVHATDEKAAAGRAPIIPGPFSNPPATSDELLPQISLSETDLVFLNNDGFQTLSHALNAIVDDVSVAGELADFMTHWIRLAICVLKMDKDPPAILLRALCKLFNSEPTNPASASDELFYTKYGCTGEEPAEMFEGRWAVRPPPTGEGDSLRITSAYIVRFVNLLGEWGGLEAVFRRLAPPVIGQDSLHSTHQLLKLVAGIGHLCAPGVFSSLMAGRPTLKDSLSAKFRALTDEDLRKAGRTQPGEICVSAGNVTRIQTGKVMAGFDTQEKLELDLALRLFQCKMLDRQLVGLTLLQNTMVATQRKEQGMKHTVKNPVAQTISSRMLLDWIAENQIVSLVLCPSAHEEIISRGSILLRYLALHNELQPAQIELLWQMGQGKPDDVQRVVYQSVAELVGVLASQPRCDELLDAAFARIVQVPIAEYNETFLNFVKLFTEKAVRIGTTKWYGLDLLWDLAQDDIKVSVALSEQAHNLFNALLGLKTFEPQRLVYLEKALVCIKEDSTVLNSLLLAKDIIRLYPEHSIIPTQATMEQVIDRCQTKFDLAELVLMDLSRYCEKARKAIESKSPASPSSTSLSLSEPQPSSTSSADASSDPVLFGRASHGVNVQERLNFLHFVMTSAALLLNREQIARLWDDLYTKAVLPGDKERLLQWLHSLADPELRSRQSASGAGTASYHFIPSSEEGVFLPDVAHFIFVDLLARADPKAMRPAGFACFEAFFCLVNSSTGVLRTPLRRNLQLVALRNAQGADALWQYAVEADDATVCRLARQLTVGLHTALDAKLERARKTCYERFVDTCLRHAREALAIAQSQPEAGRGEATQKLRNCVDLLESFMAECSRVARASGQHYDDDEDDEENALEIGTAANARDEEYPRLLLANQQEYFDVLFGMVALGGDLANKVWNVISTLPSNQRISDALFHLDLASPVPGSSTVSGEFDWNGFLPEHNPVLRLYTLRIIDEFFKLDHAEISEWACSFIQQGGLVHLYKILLHMPLQFEESLSQQAAQQLVGLIYSLQKFARLLPAEQEGGIDLSALCVRLLETVLAAFKQTHAVRIPDDEKLSSPAVSLVGNCLDLLHVLITRQPSITQLALAPLLPMWRELMEEGLIKHPAQRMRFMLAVGLLNKLSCDLKVYPEASLHSVLLPLLLELITTVPRSSPYSGLLFEMLKEMLKLTDRTKDWSLYRDIFVRLAGLLRSASIVERRASDQDVVLRGWMRVVRAVLLQRPDLKREFGLTFPDEVKSPVGSSSGGLVRWSLDAILATPTAAQISDGAEALPPMAKHPETRAAVLDVLFELASDCEANAQHMLAGLMPLHAQPHSSSALAEDWEFSLRGDTKSDSGYAGIHNPGNVCYIISVLQQLHMLPKVRANLLSVDLPALPAPAPTDPATGTAAASPPAQQQQQQPKMPSTAVIQQLQALMAQLQETERQFVDPFPFLGSFTVDGQPIDIRVQDDAGGFLTRLIDQVNEPLKKTSQAHVFREVLGGTLANQLIRMEDSCPHMKESDEEFYSLTVTVKNQRSLQDSLKQFVQGELLAGSNAVRCDLCNRKVNTLKRSVIKQLPNTLAITLKRFELDFTTLMTTKVNDYLEFPDRINMKPFTKDGLPKDDRSRKAVSQEEGKGGEDESPESKDAAQADEGKSTSASASEDDGYWYELRGVVIHMGDAERGHYYSYIRERPTSEMESAGLKPRWYEFNDSVVRDFNHRNIPDLCFGGPIETQYQSRRVEMKQSNAYILFYDRVPPIAPEHTMELKKEHMVAPPQQGLRQRLPVPEDMFQQIWAQNARDSRDQTLHSKAYLEFLTRMLERVAPPIIPRDQPVTPLSESERAKGQFFSRALLVTLARSAQKDQTSLWVDILSRHFYARDPELCRWLLRAVCRPTSTPATPGAGAGAGADVAAEADPVTGRWLQEYLLVCPHADVRRVVANLLNTAVQVLMGQPASSSAAMTMQHGLPAEVSQFVERLLQLLPTIPKHWKNFDQFWKLLCELSFLPPVLTHLLRVRHLLPHLLDLYVGSDVPATATAASASAATAPSLPWATDSKGRRIKFGGGFFYPSDLTHFLVLLSRLITAAVPPAHAPGIPLPSTSKPAEGKSLEALQPEAKRLLLSQEFLTKIVQEGTSRKKGAFVSTILTHICWEQEEVSQQVLTLVANGLKTTLEDACRSYFRAIHGLLRIKDGLEQGRASVWLDLFLDTICDQQHYWKITDLCLEHLLRQAQHFPSIRQGLATRERVERLDFVLTWLAVYSEPPVRGLDDSMHVYKPGRTEMLTAIFGDARRAPQGYLTGLSTAKKAALFTAIREGKSDLFKHPDASDSDSPLSERKFTVGQQVDLRDNVGLQWVRATILESKTLKGKETELLIVPNGWPAEYQEWLPISSARVAKVGKFTDGDSPAPRPQPQTQVLGAGLGAGAGRVTLPPIHTRSSLMESFYYDDMDEGDALD